MRRLVRISAWVLGPCLLLLVIYVLFMDWTRFSPPDVSVPSSPTVRMINGMTVLSQGKEKKEESYSAWLAPREALWEMHLSGSPVELGMAQAVLGSFLIREQETYFIDRLERLIPSRWLQRALGIYVRWRFRGLDRQIPGFLKEELRAMALAYPDAYAHLEETYQRFVYLHAFHDIAQGLERSPLIACSDFAAWGPITKDGHLIIGRNFDFEEGEIFDTNKTVLFFRPDQGIPFVSIAWAGMAGVVTGLNAEGIFICVNAARSREIHHDGLPVVLLLRMVLQKAKKLDEALSILREAPSMVADIFLLGDGKAGKAVVVEKTPYRMAVREGNGFIAATNHFLSEPIREDPENKRITMTTSSLKRYERLEELVQRRNAQIDPKTALEILRDRRGTDDFPLAPGNRNALNALIACHSVVVDATEGLIWVSESPNLLGAYRCFDLKRAFGNSEQEARRPSMDLPKDGFLTSGQYERYVLFRDYLEMARMLKKQGRLGEALDYAKRAVSLWPNHPEANLLAGRISLRRKDPDGAEGFFRRFLQSHPSDPSEAKSVQRLLEEGVE